MQHLLLPPTCSLALRLLLNFGHGDTSSASDVGYADSILDVIPRSISIARRSLRRFTGYRTSWHVRPDPDNDAPTDKDEDGRQKRRCAAGVIPPPPHAGNVTSDHADLVDLGGIAGEDAQHAERYAGVLVVRDAHSHALDGGR